MTDPNLLEIARLDKLVADLRAARDRLADIAERETRFSGRSSKVLDEIKVLRDVGEPVWNPE